MSPSAAQPALAPSSKGRTITLWVLQILAAAAFLGAGSAKLAGVREMVDTFTKVGLGQWFRYLTGLLEVAGAIGLFVPRLAFYAAASSPLSTASTPRS